MQISSFGCRWGRRPVRSGNGVVGIGGSDTRAVEPLEVSPAKCSVRGAGPAAVARTIVRYARASWLPCDTRRNGPSAKNSSADPPDTSASRSGPCGKSCEKEHDTSNAVDLQGIRCGGSGKSSAGSGCEDIELMVPSALRQRRVLRRPYRVSVATRVLAGIRSAAGERVSP